MKFSSIVKGIIQMLEKKVLPKKLQIIGLKLLRKLAEGEMHLKHDVTNN